MRTNTRTCLAGISAFLLFGVGCRQDNPRTPTLNTAATSPIEEQLRRGASDVDLRELKTFRWDRLFIFGPYYPADGICKKLSYSQDECAAAKLKDVDEFEHLPVFIDSRSIAHQEGLDRVVAEFDQTCLAQPIARDKAIFRAQRQSDRTYLVCR